MLIDGELYVELAAFSQYLRMGVGYMGGAYHLTATPAGTIAVLMYHHILPDAVNTTHRENVWTVSTESFAEQMAYLAGRHFYLPTLAELETFLYYGAPLPQHSVMITFDDGYYSNYVYAAPILREYGLRAVIFPITARAEALGERQPPISHTALTHAAAITLRYAATDVFETASHTHDLHSRYADGLTHATRAVIMQDMMQSQQFVSFPRAIAYPHGLYNTAVIAALREVGITLGFSTRYGRVRASDDPMRLPRVNVYRGMTLARFSQVVG